MVLGKISRLQFLNVLLRLLPLGAKMVLTLYMGVYFSLADMGIYGLVLGAAIILNALLGQGFGYVVARDIVHVPPLTVLHKMRDQFLLLGVNYLVLILVAATFLASGNTRVTPKVIIYTLFLAILEGIANAIHVNMDSLNQQITANAMFFVRAGLWILPVVVLGVIDPVWRTVDTVLIAWMIGGSASILFALWYWRDMPWREAMRKPIDWEWLHNGLKKSSMIWLGSLGIGGGTYVDRFVVERYLGLDDVGVVTFYFSFATAMLTVMQSGVLSFAYPRLIAMHRDGHVQKFSEEARLAFWQVALGAGLLALAMGIIVPLLGAYTHRPAFVNSAMTLWLMLVGSWIKACAETLNYVLYARHQDRAIWLGNLLFLIPTIGGNALLVPLLGLSGIGWAAIISGLFIFVWRWKYVGNMMLHV